MKKALALAVCAGALALTAAPASASHSWGGYHWARTANPFAVKLGNNVSASWQSYLSAVSADWSQASVLDTAIVPTLSGNNCKAINGRIEVCSKRYGYNGWLGLSTIWLNGGHITKSTAKVNDSYFGLAAYNNPSARRHVLCQEVGHSLGLDHSHDADSCMNDESDLSDPAGVSPNAHDLQQLGVTYTHADGSTTLASSAQDGDGGPRGRGQRVRPSMYVEDLGNGRKIVTWVFWKDAQARATAPAQPPPS